MDRQKTIFLTGATGTMGKETLKELLKRSDRFRVIVLALGTKSDRKILSEYEENKNLKIVWGDLKDSRAVDACVKDADYILHVGALVSPMADENPHECMRVNYGSTVNIINSIKKQANMDKIALVYIGSVAETGCRMAPVHWGRCGDPIKVSMFDYYGVSKVAAERAVIESGLKKWVCLRQTGMLPINKKGMRDPIIFHQNLNNVMEWITAEESGRLLANVCEDWIPESFWRKVYNVGGGERWRFTNIELMQRIMSGLEIDIKKIFDPRDFALFNFHGQWYTDSDKLNDVTKFRFIDPNYYFEKANKKFKAIKAIPLLNLLLSNERAFSKIFDSVKKKKRGPVWMIKKRKEDWIRAFFGTINKKNKIKSWEEGYKIYSPSDVQSYLDHGYDETKPVDELTSEDMKQAAVFRGGECLSERIIKGDMYTPVKWKCHYDHEFMATPYLILKTGHWCPKCEREAWNHAEIAKHNIFFAQVWNPIHGSEDSVYIKKIVSEENI